jgi:ribosomal protein S18 acetylase RimI-like enzyme
LCYETGDVGSGAARYFPDAELFSDLWMLPYSDHEPGSFWVVEDGGAVQGYLAGCLDDGRFGRRTLFVGVKVFLRALFRGSLFRPSLWLLLAANIPLWFRGGGPRLPAGRRGHLHMNLAPSLRGRGAGSSLLERYLEAARAAGLAFVHVAIREDNAGGLRFFERMGFQPLGARSAFRTRGPGGRDYRAVICVKTLQKPDFSPNFSGVNP